MPFLASLQWRPHLSPLWCGLLVLLAVLWLWLVYHRMLRRLEARRARLLLGPKVLALSLLLLALFEPVWIIETGEKVRGKLLALVDCSSSMEVRDLNNEPRLQRARAAVRALRQQLPSGIQLEVMDFNLDLLPEGEGAKGAGLRGTDVGGVLARLAEQRDISANLGIVLLTDGGDEPLANTLLPPIPVHLLGFGGRPDQWNDVAIAEISHPSVVEKGVEFEIGADLQAYTGGGRKFAVQLRRLSVTLEEQTEGQWRQLAQKTVDLSNRRARVRFGATIGDLGLRSYRLSVAPIAGELSGLNNTRHFAVEAQKKSLHLLYFTRELGMEFKTLRNELARDPGIAFTALFRTLSERFTLQGDRLAGDEEMEAGLPANEKTLQLYDALILGSFPAEDWSPEQMRALLKYVEGGGVVIFLGGDKSYGLGGYARTDIASLFPWQISDSEAAVLSGVFPVKTPLAATGHPIVSGVEEQLIREGATVESLNQVGSLKPGATVLVESQIGNRTVAVAAIHNFGKGRVLAVASNTIWKWTTRSEPLRAAYGLFWRQAVRNLTGKEEGGRYFSVKWDKEAYRPGELASPQIRSQGLGAAEVTRFSATMTLAKKTSTLTVNPLQGEARAWTTKVPLGERGDYEFRITAYRGENLLETYTKVLRVAPLVDEGARLELDEESLRRLAERGGGKFYREEETEQLARRLAGGAGRRTITMEASLAQAGPWFALLLLGTLVVEWILRRRMNLI